MKKTSCLIVGGGLAGLATARELARQGLDGVVVLEKEDHPGQHSSGRNAGMVRQLVPEPALAELGRRGAKHHAQLSGQGIFEQTGSLLLASGGEVKNLCAMADDAIAGGIEVQLLEPSAARERIPLLRESQFDLAAWTPTDGLVHIGRLLDHFRRGAESSGVVLSCKQTVQRIEIDGDGFVVETESDRFRAARLVNAAGAWADQIAELAGAEPAGLTPYRRHVLRTRPVEPLPPGSPFVWNISHEAYYRPDGESLLVSACDHEADAPGSAAATAARIPSMDSVVEDAFPGLPERELREYWAGHRTFSRDGDFVLGPDSALENFYWAAALGGHGVTTCSAVGELVASSILGTPALS